MYSPTKPIVALFADIITKPDDKRIYHGSGANYIKALATATNCAPIILPALPGINNYRKILDRVDGVMLTGSLSNVHPGFYNKDKLVEPSDLDRDKTVLPLIDHIFNKEIPMLAICRGFQEVNVAMGGSLHADIHDVPGRMDHRAPKKGSLESQYDKQHEIFLTENGKLEKLAGSPTLEVNSLHTQGIDQLGKSLVIEAVAKDETIEAISLDNYSGFFYGVQWHPETSVETDEFYKKLFSQFNDAVESRNLNGK